MELEIFPELKFGKKKRYKQDSKFNQGKGESKQCILNKKEHLI